MSAVIKPEENHKEKLVRLKDLKAFGYLLRYAKQDKWLFVGAIFLLFGASLGGVTSARILGSLAEKIMAKDVPGSYQLGYYIIALEIASVLLVYFGRRTLVKASLKSVLRIREALFVHIQNLPMSFFDIQPQGRIVTRITHDVETMESFFTGTLARLANAIISFMVVFCAMILTDLAMGLIITFSMIPVFVITYFVRQPVRIWNREFSIRNSMINAKLSEFLNGIPVIRAFGLEKWSKREFDNVVDHHLESAIKINQINAWSRPLIMCLTSIPLALFIGFGGLSVLEGTITLAIFVSFVRYLERFLQPMSVISQEMHVVQTSLINTERVVSFLQNPDEALELGEDGTYESQNLNGDIDFENVHMAYQNGTPVLKDVSFKIQSGEKIGLVGRTGSGKTSTLALLSRLYEFQKGDILIDQVSIRKWKRQNLREQIGVVNQDAIVFEASLRDNLLAGSKASDDVVLKACEESGFLDTMKKNELTLETPIFDQGANLSAGERQLLCMTRILLKNPRILVLDEATANVDPKMEAYLQNAINRLLKGRTCIIIAHRLDTLKDCDRILVFDAGKIVEQGPAEELLANKKSYYSELVHSS